MPEKLFSVRIGDFLSGHYTWNWKRQHIIYSDMDASMSGASSNMLEETQDPPAKRVVPRKASIWQFAACYCNVDDRVRRAGLAKPQR